MQMSQIPFLLNACYCISLDFRILNFDLSMILQLGD